MGLSGNRQVLVLRATLTAATALHSRTVHALLHAKSVFFDSTTVGAVRPAQCQPRIQHTTCNMRGLPRVTRCNL
jgi:hypothetical protein